MRKLVLLIGALAVLGLGACGDDDEGSGGKGQASGGCAQIIECQVDCGEDEACAEACLTEADADTIAHLFAAGMCMMGSGCADGDDACFVEACGDEFAGCF